MIQAFIKRYYIAGFWILLIAHITFVCYTYRAKLLQRFDEEYWKERHEQSQWRMLFSPRIIGDDGLYLYQGYLFSRGENPVLHNPEHPPLGKYLIGASIQLFHNGSAAGVILTTGVVITFFYLLRLITKNTPLSLFFTLLLATDPLITDQFHLTMLDSPQTLFLLLAGIGFIKYSPLFTGIFLGLSAATKFPIFLVLLVVGILLWYLSKKQHSQLVLFLVALFVTYTMSYTQYFRLGYTIVDFLRVQKHMVAFHQSSQLESNRGSLFTTLFFNRSKNLFTEEWQHERFFSPIWPIVALFGIFGAIWILLKKRNEPTVFIGAYTVSSIAILSFIPFWTRYLVALLPFLYTGTAIIISSIINRQSHKMLMVSIEVILFSLQYFATLRTLEPSKQEQVQAFAYNIQYGFFHDIYEHVDKQTKHIYSRKTFDQIGKSFFHGAQIERAFATIDTNQNTISIRYVTRYLGEIKTNTKLALTKEDGTWKIVWDWRYIHPDFSPETTTQTMVDLANRGSIIIDNERVAFDAPSFIAIIDPRTIDASKEWELYEKLSSLFSGTLSATHIHHRVVFDNPNNHPRVIGSLPFSLPTNAIHVLRSYSGVVLEPGYIRAQSTRSGTVENTVFDECCSRIYSVSTHHGTSGYEQQYDKILSGTNGGSIVFVSKDGTRKEILKQTKKDGEDIKIKTE